MKVVIDASPLISLAVINQLELLEKLFLDPQPRNGVRQVVAIPRIERRLIVKRCLIPLREDTGNGNKQIVIIRACTVFL